MTYCVINQTIPFLPTSRMPVCPCETVLHPIHCLWMHESSGAGAGFHTCLQVERTGHCGGVGTDTQQPSHLCPLPHLPLDHSAEVGVHTAPPTLHACCCWMVLAQSDTRHCSFPPSTNLHTSLNIQRTLMDTSCQFSASSGLDRSLPWEDISGKGPSMP